LDASSRNQLHVDSCYYAHRIYRNNFFWLGQFALYFKAKGKPYLNEMTVRDFTYDFGIFRRLAWKIKQSRVEH
jgi:hypothetical protein